MEKNSEIKLPLSCFSMQWFLKLVKSVKVFRPLQDFSFVFANGWSLHWYSYRLKSGCSSLWCWNKKKRFMDWFYRVSQGKVNKVIWLSWGYRFWFLLIFWVLCVYEIGPFMPSSSVFIQLMLCALYKMISKHTKPGFSVLT